MTKPIGILVEELVLKRGLRGRKTKERISLYHSIALEDRIDIIVFSVRDIRVAQNRIVGYRPTERGWKKVTSSIPKVIHKRALYRDNVALNKLEKLGRRGIIFVNPVRMQNKASMNDLLAEHPKLVPHLPPTENYSWNVIKNKMQDGTNIVLKPRIGSVGRGIIKVVPQSDGRIRVTKASDHIVSIKGLQKFLRSRISRPNRYLIQDYIDLARYDGRVFDLRVPVQRDGSGKWKVEDIVAKVAFRHPYLTNLGRGGRALPGKTALSSSFSPEKTEEITRNTKALAIHIARSIAKKYPFAADLGLDMGIDSQGKPWLIEVNTRDQRITFDEAGLHTAFRTLYKNPMAYCASLLNGNPSAHR